MHLHGAGGDLEQVGKIMLQLLLPFVLGHLSRPWIGSWVAKHKKMDWQKPIRPRSCWWSTPPSAKPSSMESGTKWAWDRCCLSSLSARCYWLLSSRSTFLSPAAAALAKPDEITIVFCGSKRAPANGIPMANILFPASILGIMVLPLMIFHQIQLMVCAVLARRYKAQTDAQQAQEKSRATAG